MAKSGGKKIGKSNNGLGIVKRLACTPPLKANKTTTVQAVPTGATTNNNNNSTDAITSPGSLNSSFPLPSQSKPTPGPATFWVSSKGKNKNPPKTTALTLSTHRIFLIFSTATAPTSSRRSVLGHSSPTSGKVVWSQFRNDIKSMTLNGEATTATVLFKGGGSKVFLFEGGKGECMRFAGVFYGTVGGSGSGSGEEERRDLGVEVEKEKEKEKESPEAITTATTSTTLPPPPTTATIPTTTTTTTTTTDPLSKYKKMIKMHVPAQAVENKMRQENISEDKIKELFALPPPPLPTVEALPLPPPPSVSISSEDESTLSKYRKMLKMHVPPQSVENKMKMESIDQKLIDVLFSSPPPPPSVEAPPPLHIPTEDESTPAATVAELSSEDEAKLTKYRKMLKMHVPPQAVENKMNQEGIEQKLIAALFPPSPAAAVAVAELSSEDEAKLTKYRKMLKMHVPPQAVENKMRQEGIEENLVLAMFPSEVKAKATFTSTSTSTNPTTNPTTTNINSQQKRKRTTGTGCDMMNLHWTPLSEKNFSKSVFSTFEKGDSGTTVVEGSDIQALEALFHKKKKVKAVEVSERSERALRTREYEPLLQLTSFHPVIRLASLGAGKKD